MQVVRIKETHKLLLLFATSGSLQLIRLRLGILGRKGSCSHSLNILFDFFVILLIWVKCLGQLSSQLISNRRIKL